MPPALPDLNLLVALHALLTERGVSRAAASIGLSQPAMSAALARLRRHYDDELLTRVGNRYTLTPLAQQLVDSTEVALNGVRRVFSAQPSFDPALDGREFTVYLSDYALAVLGGTLAELVAEQAPNVRLRLEMHNREVVDNAAETLRTTDALVLPHGFVTGMPYQDLYTDQWVCLVSADNKEIGDRLTVDQLAVLPWMYTYHRPTQYTPAAKQMQVKGIEPPVRLIAETFLGIPFLISGTDQIALIQKRLADRMHPLGNCRVLPCPFDVTPLVEALWWHPMNDRDPGHRWLRALFASAARAVS